MNFIINRKTMDWLLKGDPAIRWRVLKDLVKAPQSEILFERKKIGKEGWGRRLLSLQNEDGKWFYDNRDGAEKYSFETTLAVLNGLYEYSKLYDEKGKVYNTQKRGREFLLKHRLFRNPDNGEIINKKWLLFYFPNYWFYNILTALDYFRKNDSWDERLEDAVNIVIKKQNNDCTWNLQNRHKGETYFDMEETGKVGRWNTLRALRVLKWRVQN
jgi:hypothetical protein